MEYLNLRIMFQLFHTIYYWVRVPHKSTRKEGKKMKTILNQEENSNVFTNDESCHKNIMIFSLTAISVTPLYHDLPAYTVKLATSMNNYAKKNKINATVDVSSFSNIDTNGKEADIILLTPELYQQEEEVKNKYPDKIVKVIDKPDYGLLNAENIFTIALS